MLKSYLSLAISLLLAGLTFYVIESLSSSFGRCISTETDYESQQATEKDNGVVRIFLAVRGRCSASFVRTHEGGIEALATVIVAAFTGTLWQATRQTDRTARISAEAAQRAAEALPVVERAYLFPAPDIRAIFDWPQVPNATGPGSFFLNMTNHGKTPAILRRLSFVVLPRIPGAEPKKVDLALVNNHIFTGRRIIGAGRTTEIFEGAFQISGWHTVISGDGSRFHIFYLIVKILYDDIFGQPHETVVCRRHSAFHEDEGFDVSGPDELNYHT